MGGASKHHYSDAGVAAASEAAAPSDPVESAGPDSTGSSPGGELPDASVGAPDGEVPEATDGHNHQHPVELDLEELVARADKADEYLEVAQRTKADFENYRKRTARDAAAAQTRGVIKLTRELLPAIDNLDRALAAAADAASAELSAGIKLVHDELVAALGRVGIEPFYPEGEPFDPQYHEAVAQLPAPGTAPGTVLEVYQRGYRLGDAVIRPARVSVAG
jgi:molecular chaperone GrpE